MGLLSDTLRHLLARDPSERRAGLAGIVGRQLGAAPVRLSHPALAELRAAEAPPDAADLGFDVVHYPKSGGGIAPRTLAVSLTLGRAETRGRELMALTLADAREPDRDRFAWMLAAVALAAPERGRVVPLPPGCLGRSSHTAAVIAEPWPIARLVADLEGTLGGPLDLCVPITAREAEWIAAHGADAFLAAMRDQGVAPAADRPAGETRLARPGSDQV